MSKDRLERLDSLLRRVVAEGMYRVMQSSGVAPGTLTVTRVRCGKDLRDATVMVSVFGDAAAKEKAMSALRRRARDFQSMINAQVRLKFTPRLVFKLDMSLEKGDEVLALLDGLEAKGGGDGESGQAQDA